MELSHWAERVFHADTLEEKLCCPEGGLKSLTDLSPGRPQAWRPPARPPGLQICAKKHRKKFPRSLERLENRVHCLHVFANHELMALEMMAWALLAFPEAPPAFRRGLANVLQDEQRHFSLYAARLQELGVTFGELPVNDHFWRVAGGIASPLDWVCTMHLTFEQANLDHAPYFSRLFREVEDQASAALMQTIFEDEIRHVRFGGKWLQHYQPEGESTFAVYQKHCGAANTPQRARGPEFQTEARRRAGLDEHFIGAVRDWRPDG